MYFFKIKYGCLIYKLQPEAIKGKVLFGQRIYEIFSKGLSVNI